MNSNYSLFLFRDMLKKFFWCIVFCAISLWLFSKAESDPDFDSSLHEYSESYDEFGYGEEPNILLVFALVPYLFIFAIINFISDNYVSFTNTFTKNVILVLLISSLVSQILYSSNVSRDYSMIFFYTTGLITYLWYTVHRFRRRKVSKNYEDLVEELNFDDKFLDEIKNFSKGIQGEQFLYRSEVLFVNFYYGWRADKLNYYLNCEPPESHRLKKIVFVERTNEMTYSREYREVVNLTVIDFPERNILFKLQMKNKSTNKIQIDNSGDDSIRFNNEIVDFLTERISYFKFI